MDTDNILAEKKNSKFIIGDLVTLRTNQLKLQKFSSFIENDIGIVLHIEQAKFSDKFKITLYWQQGNKKQTLFDTRLKRIK